MPSEQRLAQILESLSTPILSFRSALSTTVEQVRGGLEAHRAGGNGRNATVGAELGKFAAGRIDPERFQLFLTSKSTLDQAALDRIDSAYATLLELAARKEKLFWFELERGANLRDEVAHALSEVGRAFKAARVIELSRSGRYGADGDNPLLGDFRFGCWNRAERNLAPPQVVFLRGDELYAEALAEFMDGSLKIVLVVEGECAPAPLVRLISPNTYVMQANNECDLRRFAAWRGPGIAAILPNDAARFTHDPDAGELLWDRVHLEHLPEGDPKQAIGGRSIDQQIEELSQLRALAEKPKPVVIHEPMPVGSGLPAEPLIPTDPVGKLAAWLVDQADLTGM